MASFAWVAAGPGAIRYLALHGAEVIHIESSKRLDPMRTFAPFKDNIPRPDHAHPYAAFHENQYSVTLNLMHPKGVEVARKLVSWADVVAESFTPRTMAKWGLGYEDLCKIKPDIIMLSSSNQGQTGPHAKHPGFGPQLTAAAGITGLTGWPDRAPAIPFGAYTDWIAVHTGAAFLIAALDYRRRTGKGLYLDLSQYEATINILAPLILDFEVNGRAANRMGNSHPYAAPHGVYPCLGEDRWCAIAVFNDKEWEGFCQTIGNPEWTQDPRFATVLGRKKHEAELDELVASWTSKFMAEEVMTRMQSAGVASYTAKTAQQIIQDPQLTHRGQFWEPVHPVIGKHLTQAPSYCLSGTPAELRTPSPCLGQHNHYVCTEILGISDEEFVKLMSEGVFE